MYAKIQKQLYDIYKKMELNAEQIYGSDPNSSVVQLWIEDNEDSGSQQSSSNNLNEINNNNTQSRSNFSSSNSTNDSGQEEANKLLNELIITDEEIVDKGGLTLETVKRLLGAVSFGYGLFQICLSFTPPNVLKLIKIFGFEGDRNIAIKAINFTSNSKDMRAPFADMVLLWYSTIAVPLFGVSEADISISDEDTKLILDRNLNKYSKSSLFLYMKGKYERAILRDLNASLQSYEQASLNSCHIKEIQLISVYEIGWIHMQNLNFAKALESFEILHKESKWSRSFCTYICAILYASVGNLNLANQYSKESMKLLEKQTRKPNPIELYSLKRNEYIKKHHFNSKIFGEFLVIELLYLWVCFPYMDNNHLHKLLEGKPFSFYSF
jgi:hypothetical protein